MRQKIEGSGAGAEPAFDVILVHQTTDRKAAQELAQALRNRGKRPWLEGEHAKSESPEQRFRKALETILRELAKEGIQPGDRRQYKSVGAAQAFAYLTGSDRVEPEHLEVLAHTLWDDPAEQPEKVARAEAKVVIESWRRHFNEVRPHSSLGYLTPAEFAAKIQEQDAASEQATGRTAAVCGASALRPVASPSRKGHAKAETKVVASS